MNFHSVIGWATYFTILFIVPTLPEESSFKKVLFFSKQKVLRSSVTYPPINSSRPFIMGANTAEKGEAGKIGW